MISLYHGDNIAASRTAFLGKKTESTQQFSLRGGEFTLTELMQVLEGGDLFSDTKHIFIEDLFGRVKKSEELTTYTAYITKQSESHTIFLWEGKALTKQQLALLPKAQVQLFKLPTTLFSFLDALLPNNTSILLAYAKQAIMDSGDEMVFAMLTRQIRILIALLEHSDIEEVKRLAPWQKTKLKTQAEAFTLHRLLHLHTTLYTIDRERKTGINATPLAESIDFFILHI